MTGKSKATDGALDAAALTVARDAIRNKCLEYFEKTWDYTVSEMFAAAAIRAYLAAPPQVEPAEGETLAWLDKRNEPAADWTKRSVVTNPEYVAANGAENFAPLGILVSPKA